MTEHRVLIFYYDNLLMAAVDRNIKFPSDLSNASLVDVVKKAYLEDKEFHAHQSRIYDYRVTCNDK